MIVPDANLLLYAYNADAVEHVAARQWWQQLIRTRRPILLPLVTVQAFLRIGTGRAYPQGATIDELISIVESWFQFAFVRDVHPGPRHWRIVRDLCAKLARPGPLMTDVHLAALAIEHGAEIHTNDVDFARFPGVRWYNPLTGAHGR
jgi:hypothetical protein